MPPRIYVDTSVVGGVHNLTFATDSTWVFDEAARGSLILLVSDVLVKEVRAGPTHLRKVIDNVPSSATEPVLLGYPAEDLRDAYLAAKVVGPKRVLDATHVAIATVAGADVLLSWDRRHIVGLVRVQGYNKVNRRLGYQELTIATPTRYRAAQTRTP
jgi:predicted nucleic acid-binding protein